jgi:putative flippase GtrA
MRQALAREAVTFLVVGALGFAVQASTLHVLVADLGIAPSLAWFPAFGIAVALTYLLNRAWTFRHRAGPAWRVELARYATLQGTGALVNYSVYAALLWLWATARDYPVLVLAAGSITAMSINFVVIRQLAFVGRTGGLAGARPPTSTNRCLDVSANVDVAGTATSLVPR